jgi:hypothetical protein
LANRGKQLGLEVEIIGRTFGTNMMLHPRCESHTERGSA